MSALIVAQQAHADEADNAVANPSEILVTAQRRSENVQNVPLSIAVIGEDKLTDFTSAGAITRFVAGTSAATYDGHLRPLWYIRGIGTADTNANIVQPIAVYFDDVYMSAPVGNGFPLFDLDHVEVLKGPQGTLYGKNTTAGLVSFFSKKPTFTPDGYLRLGAGNYGSRTFEGAVNGPIVADKLAARLSVHYDTRNSFYTNIGSAGKFPDLKDLAGRFQILANPDDKSELLLNIHGRKYSDEGRVFFPEGTSATGASQYGYVTLKSRKKVAYNVPSYSDLKQWGASARYTRSLGDLDLTSITAYEDIDYKGQSDVDYTPLEVARNYDGQRYRQGSQEFRLASPSNPDGLEWIVGAHFFYEDIQAIRSRGALPGGAVTASFNQVAFHQKTFSAAGFANATYAFSDRFKVQAGLRYTSENKRINLNRYVSASPAVFLDATRWWDRTLIGSRLSVNATQNADTTWDSIGYDLTPQFEVTDNLRLYARVSRGFRAGSYSIGISKQEDTSVVKPEILNAYELGFKSEAWDRKLTLNGAAYLYNYKDMQVNVTTPTPTGTIGNLTNGSKGRVYGGELALTVTPDDSLHFNLSAAYNHTEYLSFVTPIADYSGNQFARAPKISLSANIDKRFDLGALGTLTPSLNYDYRSKFWMFGTDQVNQNLAQGAYGLFNARVEYAPADGNWSIRLYADNLFDKDYSQHRVTPSNGTYTYAYGLPRTYGATVTAHW